MPTNFLSFSFCNLAIDSNKLIFTHKDLIHSFCGSPEIVSGWFNILKKKALVVIQGLSNDFALDTVLGASKTSQTSLATNIHSSYRYIIRSLRKDELLKNEEEFKFLVNEIQILKELSHPNIITLYEVYEEQDTLNLIMEYASGGELFDKIIRKEGYSEKDASKLIEKLLETVVYYQKKSILHRNLKLENILLL